VFVFIGRGGLARSGYSANESGESDFCLETSRKSHGPNAGGRVQTLSRVGRGAPGNGPGDFVGLIGALREIGYDGYLAMEIGFNRRDVEPDLVARQAFNYLKPLVS
jgi:sugar phosphate isomerase/epimerase